MEDWAALYGDLATWIEGQSIVIYAAPDQISRAEDLASALASRGHEGMVSVYVGGVEEWRASGMPVDSGPAPSLNPDADAGDEW